MKMVPEYEGDARSTWWYVCPECRTAVDPRDENCPECGLELDWAGLLSAVRAHDQVEQFERR